MRIARLEGEVGQARSREDLLRMQHEETLAKASAAMAFQVEIAEQQRLTIEQLQERERDLERQYRELRGVAEELRSRLAAKEKEAEQAAELGAELERRLAGVAKAAAERCHGLRSRLPLNWASSPEAAAVLLQALAEEADALEALRDRIYYLSAEASASPSNPSVLEAIANEWISEIEEFAARLAASDDELAGQERLQGASSR
ncbi:MAG: hypothetical protein N2322_07675, partial [Terrimicrobiaceae bacterium]|nr:hypothetical protein [Terrimicrobiaceae bacterium]